jgi:hypothetical protein
MLVAVVVAPRGEPVTVIVKGPEGVEPVVLMCRILVAPPLVGVTGLVSKTHLIPVGKGVIQDKVTG